jgi:FMN phosphatase YigB (HAD superfamily)
MIRAVLADWGHTLFDTAGSVEFLVRWAESRGHRVPADRIAGEYHAAFARSRSAEELSRGRDKSAARHRECWLGLWSDLEALLPGVAEALYAHETGAQGWVPFADTPGFLLDLQRRGIPLVVVSDVPFDLRPIFAHYGLAQYVHGYFLSGEHGTVKAEGSLFRMALESVGVWPDEALMIGDNPSNDGFAVFSGIRTLLLPLPPEGDRTRGLSLALDLL